MGPRPGLTVTPNSLMPPNSLPARALPPRARPLSASQSGCCGEKPWMRPLFRVPALTSAEALSVLPKSSSRPSLASGVPVASTRPAVVSGLCAQGVDKAFGGIRLPCRIAGGADHAGLGSV